MFPRKIRSSRLPVCIFVLCALLSSPALAAPQPEAPASWSFLSQAWETLLGFVDLSFAPEATPTSLRVQVGADEDERSARTDPVGETLRLDRSDLDVPTTESRRPILRAQSPGSPLLP